METPPANRLLQSKESIDFDEIVSFTCTPYTAQRQTLPLPAAAAGQFGDLIAFTQDELDQLNALRDLTVRYVLQQSPTRPMCLAVFGPPGSGKSFAVKQIRKAVEIQVTEAKLKLPLTIVNLTQVSDSTDLGRVIARIAGEQDEDTIPIVFFDEFDASRNNAPYGWLQWFLAPMHDGEFLHEGAVIRLKRAVYVFAGGTADTMAEFSARSSDRAFRAAKGPDFISRLRGYLDVSGPNSDPREARRAIVLRNELQERTKRGGFQSVVPDDNLVRALLQVGRYRHGARSIAAIVELSNLGDGHFNWDSLPEDHQLELHIDRGPLDEKLIGGSIALSGYPVQAQEHDRVAQCWLAVAKGLWQEGATLCYAGGWDEGPRGTLMQLLSDDLKKLPVEPSRSRAKRDKPSAWLRNFLRNKPTPATQAIIDAAISPEERTRYGLAIFAMDYLTAEERAAFADEKWSRRVIQRFRRRLVVSEGSVARFAVAGATRQHGGRVPGIAEELMLTLALGKPIYVAGAFGGAAQDCGSLLGLGPARTGDIPESLYPQPEEPKLAGIADKLRPGPWTSMPLTAGEVASFLKKHSIGGPDWPNNGLSVEDNRLLFASEEPKQVVELVVKGLRRCFATANTF